MRLDDFRQSLTAAEALCQHVPSSALMKRILISSGPSPRLLASSRIASLGALARLTPPAWLSKVPSVSRHSRTSRKATIAPR